MVIDFHTHIFPAVIRNAREDYFEGEPAFELLYAPPRARLAGAGQLITIMDEQGVDVSVVFGFPWRNADTFRMHNDYIIEAVRRYPQRLVGLACLDTASPAAAAEIERCMDAGLAGMGELAFYASGIDEACLRQLAPLMEICRRRRLLALIHTNEPVGHRYPGKTPNTLNQIYRLINAFPDNTLVLAHWGGGLFFYNLLKKEVKASFQNVYFDTAASPYLYDTAVYRIAAETVGAGKVLLGTDFPLLQASRYFNEMKAAGIHRADREAICGDNAATLLATMGLLPQPKGDDHAHGSVSDHR